MSHAFLAPSSAWIWGPPNGCRAYPRMAQKFPELEETEEAKEGTAAHEIAAAILLDRLHVKPHANYVGTAANNGVMIDQWMQESAEFYADEMVNLCRRASVFCEGESLAIERRVDIFGISPDNWGTPDFWVYDRLAGIIHVADFKYGFGRVEAFENWQMIDYLAGIIDLLGIDGSQDQHIRFEAHVIQPRAYHRDGVHRTWGGYLSDLRGYHNILTTSAGECLETEPVQRVGKGCVNCPGRTRCEAFTNASYSMLDYASRAEPNGLTPFQVGLELMLLDRAFDIIEARRSGMEEQALHYYRSGEVVPGRVLEATYGRTAWKVKDAEILALGGLLGVDLRSEKATTPTKAKALLKESASPSSIIDSYTHKPSSGVKLRVDDGSLTRRIFKND